MSEEILIYQKNIIILESSIKSLSLHKLCTIDLQFKIAKLKEKINMLLQKNKSIKINLIKDKELRIYKQFLKHQLKTYFLEKGYIVVKNFVRDVQVWMPSKKGNTTDYNLYYKFLNYAG